MLSCAQHQTGVRKGILDELVTVIVVRWQKLFHPLEIKFGQLFPKLDCIRHCQGHVAVQRQREVRSDRFSPLLAELDVLTKTLVAGRRAVRAGDLGTNEAHLLR